jgi:hypothetical protein
MYSFFFRRHSLAASLFLSSLISRFLSWSSPFPPLKFPLCATTATPSDLSNACVNESTFATHTHQVRRTLVLGRTGLSPRRPSSLSWSTCGCLACPSHPRSGLLPATLEQRRDQHGTGWRERGMLGHSFVIQCLMNGITALKNAC